VRNETHGVEECIISLAQKVEKLEREKIDRDSLMTLLLRKVDRKTNDQLLHLLVNDFDAARSQLNKQYGGIRIKPKATPSNMPRVKGGEKHIPSLFRGS